jgi:hypothetical protein
MDTVTGGAGLEAPALIPCGFRRPKGPSILSLVRYTNTLLRLMFQNTRWNPNFLAAISLALAARLAQGRPPNLRRWVLHGPAKTPGKL